MSCTFYPLGEGGRIKKKAAKLLRNDKHKSQLDYLKFTVLMLIVL